LDSYYALTMAPLIPESAFSGLETAPYDEVFALMAAFNKDTSADKVSLGAGVYRDNEGRSWRLPAVNEVSTEELCSSKKVLT
jgi:aspartate aminotransferase